MEDIIKYYSQIKLFKGMPFNEETKNKILNMYPNYIFDVCDSLGRFEAEYCCHNSIRVLVKNDIIEEIKFGG